MRGKTKSAPNDNTKHVEAILSDMAARESARIAKDYAALSQKYNRLIDRAKVIDRLVDLAESRMRAYPVVSYKPRKVSPPSRISGTPETAVLVLSDSHVGQVVLPDQTLGFGKYDFRIFCSRLALLEERVASILNEHVTPPVDELVVMLLGDMLHGNLLHDKEIVNAMTLFDQFYAAAHCFSQMLLNLSQHVPSIRVYTAVGNHTRWCNQKKMPLEQRYSNLDHFLYAMIKEMVSANSRISFNLDTQPFCYFSVKGISILGMHGEHLRGGDKQMGIPIHAIARQVSGLTQLYESRNIPAPHLWVMGDKHKSIQLPTIKGEFIVNGSFVGDDNFSLTLSTGGEPMQLLFGVHPKYRKSWEYKIKLAHARNGKRLAYSIPDGLQLAVMKKRSEAK